MIDNGTLNQLETAAREGLVSDRLSLFPWWGNTVYLPGHDTYLVWGENPGSDWWGDYHSTVLTAGQVVCQMLVLALEDDTFRGCDDALNGTISEFDMDTVLQTLVYGDIVW